MSKLYRPTIPVEVKCRVVLRQLGEMFPDKVIEDNRPRRDAGYMVGVVGLRGRSLGRLLAERLERLAELLNCKVEELRLDHDPALGVRMKRTVGHPPRQIYSPDANDPEHLRYRPHGAQHADSHDVKTRIRGDHGQYSDIALIKRERRREKRALQQKRGNPEKSQRLGRRNKPAKKASRLSLTKPKWPKRSFPKRRKQ